MSVEQVARDFISNIPNQAKVKAMLTPDAMGSGGILPKPIPAAESFKTLAGLMAGFPDLKFDIQQVTVNGDKASVKVQITGTNTGTITLPVPGAPSVPATGKKVSIKDAFVVTVKGDKVSEIHVDSPADGGIPAMLAQIGVKMPAA